MPADAVTIVSPRAIDQIDELSRRWGCRRRTETVIRAIEREHLRLELGAQEGIEVPASPAASSVTGGSAASIASGKEVEQPTEHTPATH